MTHQDNFIEKQKTQKIAKISLVISMGTLIIAILALVYTWRIDARGPIWGKARPIYDFGEKLAITNSIWGLRLSIPIEIRNNGTADLRIGKIKAIVSYENGKEETFIARSYIPSYGNHEIIFGTKTINPKEIWNVKLVCYKKLTSAEVAERGDLTSLITVHLQDKYLKHPDPKASYELTDKSLLNRIRDKLNQNTSWMRFGDYLLRFVVFNESNDSIIYEKQFRFHLSREQLKSLKVYQFKSYRYPPFGGNLFVTFIASPTLQPIHTQQGAPEDAK